MQGKGAPQLWLVGVSCQIVCISSSDLTSILLRAENSGQKPDVTSFFDGFISLLPVASVPMAPGTRHHGGKSGGTGAAMPADVASLQQLTLPTARGNSSSRPAAASVGQSSHYEADIRQLKHVLDSISTTKTIAKITLMQQASCLINGWAPLSRSCFVAGAHVAQSVRVFRRKQGKARAARGFSCR